MYFKFVKSKFTYEFQWNLNITDTLCISENCILNMINALSLVQ